MRILHILHQYLPERVGGTELYTRTLAHHQAQAGHHVAIFTPAAQTPTADGLTPAIEDGIYVYRIPLGSRSATAVFRDTFSHPDLTRAFAAIVAQENPNLIHIQHLMGLPAAIGDHMRQSAIPYVVTLHDYWFVCPNAQLLTNYDETVCQGPNLWLNCARCALARAGHARALPLIPAIAPFFAYRHHRLWPVLTHARALITPTHFTGTVHRDMGLPPEKIRVVPHGITLPETLPPRQSSNKYLHIGYIGGLSFQKGVHVLIDAVNQMPETAVRLSIIGDPTAFPAYVARLQRQAQHPGINFRGRMPHAELWTALAEINVIVVPSLWYETASLIVQEAFAAGVPVVASDLGALKERVQDGIDGRLFPPGNATILHNILLSFHAQPASLDRIRTGIQPVRTIANHVNEIMAIYQEAAKETVD